MRRYVFGIGKAAISFAAFYAFGWVNNHFSGQDIWYFTTIALFGLLAWAYVELEAKHDGDAETHRR